MAALELGPVLGASEPVGIKNEVTKTEVAAPIMQEQDGDTQQMAMAASTLCPAARAALCQKCGCSESTTGHLDERGAESRAWGTGALCHWCEEVEGIEAQDPTMSFQGVVSDVPSQLIKLQAYFSLVMEGHINITHTQP